ncbi:MAG TPA: hypothetical protein VEJ67_13470 [Candidatus Cybelea sp.]|nr:hypothetical protein [Candidatus Cybelea sp.]
MRVAILWFLAGLATVFPADLRAQTTEGVTHAPSGGSELIIASISVPPIPNAPFTAKVSTQWARKLEDGTTVTIENHRTIARDSSGRVYQERRTFHPVGDAAESIIRQVEYADPSSHELYVCRPVSRTCEIENYFVPAKVAVPPPPGEFDEGRRFLSRVGLGTDTVAGLEAIGSRETMTIFAGTIGNDRAVEVIKEFWYSPQLGINLIEKRQDPRWGMQNFEVSDISQGEPDPKLFELPANFRLVDMRGKPRGADSGDSN